MAATSSTESMIKAWIVADYLRQLGDKEPPAALKKQASTAIRDSNDDAANGLRRRRLVQAPPAAAEPVIQRADQDLRADRHQARQLPLRRLVELHPDVPAGRGPARRLHRRRQGRRPEVDQVGAGRDEQGPRHHAPRTSRPRPAAAAGASSTACPKTITAQGPVSIKNGWTPIDYDGNWHVNCLAVTDKWSLAVMLRYPRRTRPGLRREGLRQRGHPTGHPAARRRAQGAAAAGREALMAGNRRRRPARRRRGRPRCG